MQRIRKHENKKYKNDKGTRNPPELKKGTKTSPEKKKPIFPRNGKCRVPLKRRATKTQKEAK